MRLDRPSGGSDKPGEGNHPPQPIPPPNSSYWSYGRRPPDFSSFKDSSPDRSPDRPRESNEGTGWPKEKPDAKPDIRTDAEKIKDLESELGKVNRENARLTVSYEKALGDLQRSRQETGHYKRELENQKIDNSRLTETNSLLVRDNMALRKKTEASSAFDRNTNGSGAQTEMADKKPQRKNWFPTDKMGSFGGAVATAGGTYAVMVGRVGSKEEAFGMACAGAGIATLALGREITDKINAWRDKRAEKKNADR